MNLCREWREIKLDYLSFCLKVQEIISLEVNK